MIKTARRTYRQMQVKLQFLIKYNAYPEQNVHNMHRIHNILNV